LENCDADIIVPRGRTPERSNFSPNTSAGGLAFDDDDPDERLPLERRELDEREPERAELRERDERELLPESSPSLKSLSSSEKSSRLEREREDERDADEELELREEPRPPPLEPEEERDDELWASAKSPASMRRSVAMAMSIQRVLCAAAGRSRRIFLGYPGGGGPAIALSAGRRSGARL
jgi:hypothetical protein